MKTFLEKAKVLHSHTQKNVFFKSDIAVIELIFNICIIIIIIIFIFSIIILLL